MHSQQKAEAEAQLNKEESDDLSTDDALKGEDDDEEHLNDSPDSWGHKTSKEPPAEETPLESKSEVAESESTPREDKKRRHLDLDDFANSPAADADDTASTDSGEDVEMRVTMG